MVPVVASLDGGGWSGTILDERSVLCELPGIKCRQLEDANHERRGIPIQVVLAIQPDPQDESSLCGVMIDERQSAVPLFTQRKFAGCVRPKRFGATPLACIAPSRFSISGRFCASELCEGGHVVTDPIVGSPSYLDQKTLTMSEYLKRLGGLSDAKAPPSKRESAFVASCLTQEPACERGVLLPPGHLLDQVLKPWRVRYGASTFCYHSGTAAQYG